jgi:hypothetical protein
MAHKKAEGQQLIAKVAREAAQKMKRWRESMRGNAE